MLETTYEQYLRLAPLLMANDCITDAIEALPVFPLYSFDPETLYGAVDGQNLAANYSGRLTQDKSLRRVAKNGLRRGDLIFFNIKTQETADHVGGTWGMGSLSKRRAPG